MGTQMAIDRIAQAPTIVSALRAAEELAVEAGRDPGVRTLRLLTATLGGDDDIIVLAAVHALAEMQDADAGALLCELLRDPRPWVREHAAWALGQSMPQTHAIAALIRLVAGGGFTGMLAQQTLEKWSSPAGETLVVALESALLGGWDVAARPRLVETLGLVRHPSADAPLRRFAFDTAESDGVREAAIAALGQRADAHGQSELERQLDALVDAGGRLGDVARLALIDLDPPPAAAPREGLTVAQLFLHADIDPSLSSAGAGDNGGIATLLVRLGDALLSTDDAPAGLDDLDGAGVTRVLTLSRGSVQAAGGDLLTVAGTASGHVYGRVPLGTASTGSAAAWPLRVAARRGIRRLLRAAGRVDVLHLRMADVGSLAAADVARELGIPTVFTVAPDPHSVIASMDRSGALTRSGFGAVDQREHFWFRTRLVQGLAASASHTVFFPRPELARDMRELVGIELDEHPDRRTVVAEGVDLEVIDRAVAAAAYPGASPDLAEMLDALPAERRRLPLLLSVGRLHKVKGMATLVATWAGSALSERANLLIVGGDLDSPSPDEREQLDLIAEAVPEDAWSARGLLIAGHRPNDVTARWLAAARLGMPGRAAPGGAYVCASMKEEFGLALLEAMAAGLVVVAPDGDGPATYVLDGDTGFLTATWDSARLEEAVDAALDRAAEAAADSDGDLARRARRIVADRFTIQAMARALAPVYRGVAAAEEEIVRAATGIPA
ncbi:glycosyltransferase [Microbacterium aurantiacum]|uniref:D-inositol 3-phosphate glycosyltransferase n=1 Tax=Microbacterium aurantiacum TaxID=162393 RepID=A0ABT8FU47_9MICO|nr:glycosyltransferase [Microbacterium aurantiacum]MDN4464848.1 glycosyltransferase [Microbacterium aurantiacum]